MCSSIECDVHYKLLKNENVFKEKKQNMVVGLHFIKTTVSLHVPIRKFGSCQCF